MNQEIKKLWTDALESGEYKQGTDVLHRIHNNTFCCLGVLCELHRKLTNGPDWIKEEMSYKYSYIGSSGVLPEEVMDWAGLNQRNPIVEGTLLSKLNDNWMDFKQIATLIKENL